jgi:hypothetical protein
MMLVQPSLEFFHQPRVMLPKYFVENVLHGNAQRKRLTEPAIGGAEQRHPAGMLHGGFLMGLPSLHVRPLIAGDSRRPSRRRQSASHTPDSGRL